MPTGLPAILHGIYQFGSEQLCCITIAPIPREREPRGITHTLLPNSRQPALRPNDYSAVQLFSTALLFPCPLVTGILRGHGTSPKLGKHLSSTKQISDLALPQDIRPTPPHLPPI